jgi:Xaa-Pro aminopeptidase
VLFSTAGLSSLRINIRTRNRDVDYPFRQDSDFYYLTGFNEADALAVFIPGRKQGEYILFCQEFDEKKALWEGAHAGLEGATQDFGADDSFPIDDLNDILPVFIATWLTALHRSNMPFSRNINGFLHQFDFCRTLNQAHFM